ASTRRGAVEGLSGGAHFVVGDARDYHACDHIMGRAGTVQRVHAAAQPPGANRKHGGQQSRVSLLIGAIGAVTSAKTCGKQAERWQGGKVVSALALMHCANALCASAKPAAALHLCKGSLPCRCMDAGSRGLRLTLESRWATIHLA